MFNYQYFKIIFTVLLILLGMQLNGVVTDSIAYFLILTLGIVHGANDLLILKQKENNSSLFLTSVLGYLGLIGLCVVSFFVHPFVSILLFILISAYHFGEQHFENQIDAPNWITYSFYIFYGLVIFGMIFLENTDEVDVIVSELTGQVFPDNSILIGTLLSGGVLVSLILYGVIKKYSFQFNTLKEIFILALIYLAFRYSSLILGFGIYFIFWHSIPSIIDQTTYLSGATNKKSMLYYFKMASPYWLLSIVGLTTLYFLMDESLFSSAIFLILFSVTAPHAWVMFRMKKSNE